MSRIVLVSRDLYPVVGSGVAARSAAIAGALTGIAEVTLVSSERHRAAYEALVAGGDARIPAGVRVAFAWEPEETGNFYGPEHHWSARVLDAIAEHFPDGGPDLVEAPDRDGEGMVLLQAQRALDERVRRSLVVVRLHGSSEIRARLNTRWPRDAERRVPFELERFSVARAPRLLAPAPGVLAAYRQLAATHPLPARGLEEARLLAPGLAGAPAAPPALPPREGPLRLLYASRLERRKGIEALAEAVAALPGSDWRLTIAGADTPTAAVRRSMRDWLEASLDGDPRVRLATGSPDPAAHDVVIVPSLWDAWPGAALAALAAGVPVLGTPVGGLTALVQPGRSGWLCDGTSPDALARALLALIEDPAAVRRLRATGGPRAVYDELCDPAALARGYAELLEESRAARRSRAAVQLPPVSVVIPFHGAAGTIAETVAHVRAQSVAPAEVIVVADGDCTPAEDALLESLDVRIVAQRQSGVARARETGARLAHGELVAFVDADDLPEPTWLERCATLIAADADCSGAASWLSFLEPDGRHATEIGGGFMPLGTWTPLLLELPVGMPSAFVLRRSVLDGVSFPWEAYGGEDTTLSMRLMAAGRCVEIVPQKLVRYRILTGSARRQEERSGLPSEWTQEERVGIVRRDEVDWAATDGAPGSAWRAAPPQPQPSALETLEQANARLRRLRAGLGPQAASRALVRRADEEAPPASAARGRLG